MAKSTVAKEVKSVWNMVMTQLSEGVINGHRVAAKDLVVAPIWRFSKEVEGVHLFTHGNREYWVISEKDTEIKTKGKGFFGSTDVEVKVRNFYLVPKTSDHKGRPCYVSYLTNIDTLVKQGILKECWGDISKAEMSGILSQAVKMLAEAQNVPVSKFKSLAKTLKIGAISGGGKKGKTGKKTEKSTEVMIQEALETLGQKINDLVSQNQFVAETPVVAPVVEKPVAQPETPVQKPAPVVQPEAKAAAPVQKPVRPAKAAASKATSVQQKSKADVAASQLSEQLAAMDLLDEAQGKKSK